MKKNVLFVCALSKEQKIVKNNIKKYNFSYINAFFLTTGPGNYNTIFNLTNFLKNYNINFLVNIGICGWKEKENDFIQVSKIYNINTNQEKIIPSPFFIKQPESIACSETPVYNENFLKQQKFVDMESFGFEFVSEKFELPRVSFKIPVDKIGEQTKKFDIKKAIYKLQEFHYYNFLQKLNRYLQKLPQEKESYKDIKKYFKLTYQEYQQIKFLAKKYEAITGNRFREFFENNKELNKKNFFQKLSEI